MRKKDHSFLLCDSLFKEKSKKTFCNKFYLGVKTSFEVFEGFRGSCHSTFIKMKNPFRRVQKTFSQKIVLSKQTFDPQKKGF